MASGAADEVIEEACAKAAHEVSAAYAHVFAPSRWHPHWEDEQEGGRLAMHKVVDRVLGGADASAIHMLRCQRLEMEGWSYGPALVQEGKVTPILVPFEKLPEAQACKEILMVAVINAVALALGHTSTRARTVRVGA